MKKTIQFYITNGWGNEVVKFPDSEFIGQLTKLGIKSINRTQMEVMAHSMNLRFEQIPVPNSYPLVIE